MVHLRRSLLLPLDDLLAVTREFIGPRVSRSGLDRCLRRHAGGNPNALKPSFPQPAHQAFKSYEPGYVHVDVKYLPQMQDESSRRYLFVAIDRATRWVFVQLKTHKTAASAQAFLRALNKACPIRITKVLTDNGKEFTDRLFAGHASMPVALCALFLQHKCALVLLLWGRESNRHAYHCLFFYFFQCPSAGFDNRYRVSACAGSCRHFALKFVQCPRTLATTRLRYGFPIGFIFFTRSVAQFHWRHRVGYEPWASWRGQQTSFTCDGRCPVWSALAGSECGHFQTIPSTLYSELGIFSFTSYW